MRLGAFWTVSAIATALGLLLVVAASSLSSAATASNHVTMKLVCVPDPHPDEQCGANFAQTDYNGFYVAAGEHGFPANVKFVVQTWYPNGQKYNPASYTNPGTLFGRYGTVGTTNTQGQLSWFRGGTWHGLKLSANHGPNKPTDPPNFLYPYTMRIWVELPTGVVAHAKRHYWMIPLNP